MKSGYKKTHYSFRDYDLLKTRKLAGVPQTLPDNYSVDAGLRVPNQEAQDDNFTPPVPPLPYGCTDYSQAEICGDEDQKLYNPMDLENITHANARGGIDLRVALDAVVKLYPDHPAYFKVSPSKAIDAFDAVRLAMLSTTTERRGVSVGSPYWLQWGAVGPSGILPNPDYDLKFASWHNWVIKGWKTIDGTCYLVCQMLQGANYGDRGFVYMTREVFNATMNVSGSIMFAIDKLMAGETVQTVDFNIIKIIVNYVRSLFGL